MISLKNELTTGFVVGLIVLTVASVASVLVPEFTKIEEEEPPTSWEMYEENEVSRPMDENLEGEIYENTVETIPSLGLNYFERQDIFELPLIGATGYASVTLDLCETTRGEVMQQIPEGKGFLILGEADVWLKINYRGAIGFVHANHCMINLPDVLPSAIYKNTNGTSSMFRSSFVDLPNVTGKKLYDSLYYNERLGKEEYMMPVLYQTAKKIALAQRAAMENGETLIIYELFRPVEVEELLVTSLSALSRMNATVLEGLNKEPFSLSWFASANGGNHQKGMAIDVSLGRVIRTEEKFTGDYVYTDVVYYEEYQMQTPIHELSYHSASMTKEWIYPEGWTGATLGVQRSPYGGEITFATLTEQEEMEMETTMDTPEMNLPETLPPVYTPDLETIPQEETQEENQEIEEEILEETPLEEVDEQEEELEEESWEEEYQEEYQEAEPVPPVEAVPYLSEAWSRATTMTEDALRLQQYFRNVGMEPMATEWWHFDDFNSGGSEENKGKYTMDGIYSVAPRVSGV